MKKGARCYLASPLGFSEAGRLYYTQVLLPAISEVVEVVDPWSIVTDEEISRAAVFGKERELAAEIGRRNREAISDCRLLAAVLDGQELDSGTAAEIGFASALGLTCFGLRTDLREIGERGATVNLQVEAFIALSGGRIVSTPEDLACALQEAAGRGELAQVVGG